MNWFAKPKFFSPEQMQDIHQKSLELLSSKGVVFKSEKALKILEENGAKVEGVVLKQGTPDEIIADDKVRKTCLGKDFEL